MLNFLFGFSIGLFLFEPIIINFIYMTNPGLFNDLILTKKSSYKLSKFYISKYLQESRDL